jgi:hypothetical protein
MMDSTETDIDGKVHFELKKSETPCEHLDFECLCNCGRIQKDDTDEISYYVLEVEVRCKACRCSFSFEALPRGFNPNEPTASVFGLRAHLPMHPFTDADEKPETLRYVVNRKPARDCVHSGFGRITTFDDLRANTAEGLECGCAQSTSDVYMAKIRELEGRKDLPGVYKEWFETHIDAATKCGWIARAAHDAI